MSSHPTEAPEPEGKMAQPTCKFVFPVLLKNGVFYLPGANSVDVMAPSDPQRGRWGSETLHSKYIKKFSMVR